MAGGRRQRKTPREAEAQRILVVSAVSWQHARRLCQQIVQPTLNPTPYTLHPTPYTLHPTSYTLNPKPYSLHSTA